MNDFGVSPIFGPLWHRSVIRYMLANPAYLGYPTWNKASNSRFMEFCDGQIKTVAEKEAELETLLDGFAGLSPKLKEQANRRGEALQEEIDALRRDLCDLRLPWDRVKDDLREREAASGKAVSTLNEEGQHRQKAEALRSVVGDIVCHFQEQGKRRKLVSIEVAAAEDGAVQPLTFPGVTLQSDTRLSAFA